MESARKHVQRVQAELERDRSIKKQWENKSKHEYDVLPKTGIHDFVCSHCLSEFTAPAYKSWSETLNFGAWIGFCPVCTSMVSRWITNKPNDPYYELSRKIRIMRFEHQHDMLQPGMYGFQTLYGDAFEAYHKRFGDLYEQAAQLGASIGLRGVTYEEKTERQRLNDTLYA